jgi:hypothetical protein
MADHSGLNTAEVRLELSDHSRAASSMNEGAVREILSAKYKWPTGLQTLLISSLQRIPLRFFICDDSGSMMTTDGHRVESGK